MAMTGTPGRATRTRRTCENILDAANAVFLERGYSGASIDAIVERAGCSKETVYAHFTNKAGLLKSIVERGTEVFRHKLDLVEEDRPIKDVLLDVAKGYLIFILTPEMQAFYRLVIAESGRMPEVGDVFYRQGPEITANRLAARLRLWQRDGLISPDDPDRAAVIFFAMLRGDLQWRVLFNATRSPTTVEIDTHAAFVVDGFLALCRYRDPATRSPGDRG